MAISTSYRNMSSFLSSHAASLPRGCAPGRTAQTSTFARVPKRPAPPTPLRLSSSACGRGRAACAASSGQDQIGVVIVDHGSKKQASNEMLEQFAEVFDLYSDYDIVESAHMEIAEPTILQASEKCIQRGATSVVITPYFLSRYSVPQRPRIATLKRRNASLLLHCFVALMLYIMAATPQSTCIPWITSLCTSDAAFWRHGYTRVIRFLATRCQLPPHCIQWSLCAIRLKLKLM